MNVQDKNKVQKVIEVLDRFAEATPLGRQWHQNWLTVWSQVRQGIEALVVEEEKPKEEE